MKQGDLKGKELQKAIDFEFIQWLQLIAFETSGCICGVMNKEPDENGLYYASDLCSSRADLLWRDNPADPSGYTSRSFQGSCDLDAERTFTSSHGDFKASITPRSVFRVLANMYKIAGVPKKKQQGFRVMEKLEPHMYVETCEDVFIGDEPFLHESHWVLPISAYSDYETLWAVAKTLDKGKRSFVNHSSFRCLPAWAKEYDDKRDITPSLYDELYDDAILNGRVKRYSA